MLRINQFKMKPGYTKEELNKKVAAVLKLQESEIKSIHIAKESLDARKKPEIYYVLTLDVVIENEQKTISRCRNKEITVVKQQTYSFPAKGSVPLLKRPVVVGAGPAGLICAYYLAKSGFSPILLERGKCVEERSKDVEYFFERGILNTQSNIQFGEGGAGTFSDGKLNTLIKDKYGRNHEILNLLVQMGAPEDILYKQKPHVGTDVLISVVRNLRNAILESGGEIRFSAQVTGFEIKDHRIMSLTLNEKEVLPAQIVVLAIGHSARDTFYQLLDAGLTMTPKPFAVGYRVMHSQDLINHSQYGNADMKYLPVAEYKLTAASKNGRSVYSFCMCPGGYVVNASSEALRTAVNGMSYRARNSKSANSAIVISVTPEDFPSKHPLAGVEFQRALESKAFQAAKGKIPVQLYGDFKQNRISEAFGEVIPCFKGEYQFADVRSILPEELNLAFLDGMKDFGRKIKNFDMDDCILAGIESRTSSPVRMERDEGLVSNIKGIYPCGEGAGYAGGITSAAMDGLKVAEEIATIYYL